MIPKRPVGRIDSNLGAILIIETSLAPSPTANVTAFLFRLTKSTTKAFCNGVTRQQITAWHWQPTSKNKPSRRWSNAWAKL
uniref:Uncharacterized protein n=1 Tax=Romanomermis culicivorax TaxID=13658 RepID=A0A915HLA5_ROMCU